jgi:hypothetical protein
MILNKFVFAKFQSSGQLPRDWRHDGPLARKQKMKHLKISFASMIICSVVAGSLPANAAAHLRTATIAQLPGSTEPVAMQQARVQGSEQHAGIYACGQGETHTGLEKKVC